MSLKVNFSSEEAASEGRSVDLLPRGEYHVKITGVEDRECGENSNNPGKPYWGMEFTVQDGKYENRKLWTNCMLFSPALYTLSQLMKALGHNIREGSFEVPEGEDLVGRDVVVAVKIKPKSKGKDGQEYDERNEVQGIKAWTEGMTLGATTGTATKKAGSLLP
jgi:hypothetical protein